ncbi:unnamed protein product [Pneumocystis jirovecii]|uniref:U3 small nucleolar ribonucleoprotein protein IMP4 n=2 Tax=Pneumocystis jirovecii TaxID=42068 RepID=L0P8L5_PNEJI|nr:snoRNA-binding rRNA-processing protein IMP4 [Pneumocystis jirovecii RU7]KTW26282.1 hypothetical protein T551_03581 [Pneumocystis jirovecii RU7]CCJ28728.1 unnamed protein product [Pneumocystis jirovecii]
MQQKNEAQLREKRRLLKESLEKGKSLPSDIRDDAQLRKDYKFDEGMDEEELNRMDDEYGNLGEREPKILITTSREPSTKLSQFAKEIKLLIPNSRRINRGNYVINDIVAACRSNDITDLIILHETRGVPDCLIISHFPYGPTVSFTLHNVILRHDIPNIGNVSESYPRLIMLNLTSKLGLRVKNVLKALFPPSPKENSHRVITFANQEDYISLRHHVYLRTDSKNIELVEVGPRLEMHLYEIKLGTIDMPTADIEWRLKPYQRHKSYVLSDT